MDCACGKPVMGKQDACRSCFLTRLNADPEHQAKRAAAVAARWAKPGACEKQAEICRRSVAKRDATPGMRERYVQRGKQAYQRLQCPDVLAKTYSPDAIARRAAANSETRLGWCPPEYRDAYRQIRQSRGMRREEAKRIILEQIKIDQARAEARLTPFERQMRALERGARLVANDRKPSLDNPAAYSFGGR